MTQLNDKQESHGEGSPNVVGVRFQRAGKAYHFISGPELSLTVDDWVVVETIYGHQVGEVAEVMDEAPDEVAQDKLRPVLRRATGLDMARYQVMQERARRMIRIAEEEIADLRLDVKPVSSEFTLDGKSALVMITGSLKKQDYGQLRRRLSSRMSCRVELRTVGPRDHAKELGGHGVCGLQRCCSRFLTDFQAVSIRMAKDQAISMAPSDITGMCGRLRCCLAYEHQVYKDASVGLPRIKARVNTEKGVGRVIDLDILKEEVIVEIPPHGPRRDRERFRFAVEDVEVIPRDKQ